MSDRLTAREAAKRAKATREINPQTVAAVVDCWLHAVKQACDEGKTRLPVGSLPVLRMPVTHREHEAAREELRKLGYAVCANEISWDVREYEVTP